MPVFFTYKQPVVQHNGVFKPLYDPALDFGISESLFSRHYVQRYYTKGLLHYLIEKIMHKHPQKFRFWVEIAIMEDKETEEYIEAVSKDKRVELMSSGGGERNGIIGFVYK